jgi:ribonucleoside-diphosphate reductase alpha chain
LVYAIEGTPMQLSGIAHQIWDEKYRYKTHEGEPVDLTVSDTFTRVARALASVEAPSRRSNYEQQFYDAMSDFSVIPAGRIVAGAGTGRNVTLMNCYVLGNVPDSLEGIMDILKAGALTMKEGGGIGTDFSTLRPKGAMIETLGSASSGPLAFMDQWDAMCRSIMSAGHRRGAMMGTLRIDHPDIEAFIEAKRDSKRFRMFNISILVPDAFMAAVRLDDGWDLKFGDKVYKRVRAVELWDKVMQATYDVADPGVIFIDRVNATNPLNYAEEITCTNPCGEQPLPPWGACCLGSVNLTRMVRDPFTARASVDYVKLNSATQTLLRMLDNVLDVSHYPLEQQRQESMNKRRVGIGITGLADMFAMLGYRYDSLEAVKCATSVADNVRAAAEQETFYLGEEKGSFPLYDAEKYGNGKTVFKHRRNSHVTSIAPTGTISLFAGNISSGIEPIFDLSLKRKILQKDDSWKQVEISDYAWGLFNDTAFPRGRDDKFINDSDRSTWVTAADIKPIDHLNILAAVQPYVDSSISKTINCPKSISFEDFKDIYLEAYRLGCKSCTTYRPNEVTGSILSSDSMAVSEVAPMDNVVEFAKPLVRPHSLHGTTYRLKPSNVEHALFITINDIEQGGRRHPFEVFINTKNLQFLAWSTALTRMISAIFRRGGDVSFIIDELAAVFDPHGGGYWEDKQYVPSIIAGIGKVIEKHLEGLGTTALPLQEAKHCPKCNGALLKKEGCWSCTTCSYSACG